MKSGILLLDKPRGLTSNAALGRAKRVLGIRKAGHTGALDPMATGLLPLCFGEATKVSAFLLDADKAYTAELRLGETTASGDADGEVIDSQPVPALTAADLEAVLTGFRGAIEQVPPMYSALKHKGRRLHELARAGIEVERSPRTVRIERLEVLELEPARIVLRVDCSKGTYIRSLAVDIGAVLGCGAHLSGLVRTRSGPFTLGEAIGLEPLEGLDPVAARARLLPADRALADLPAVVVEPAQGRDLGHGRPVAVALGDCPAVRMYAGEAFVGVGRVVAGRLQVRRLIRPDSG